jgi:hypothetical protein
VGGEQGTQRCYSRKRRRVSKAGIIFDLIGLFSYVVVVVLRLLGKFFNFVIARANEKWNQEQLIQLEGI